MGTRRPLEARIQAVEERIQQLQARKQALEAQARQKARKERTRRLIQMGGVLAAWGLERPDQVEALLRLVRDSAIRDDVLAALGIADHPKWT